MTFEVMYQVSATPHPCLAGPFRSTTDSHNIGNRRRSAGCACTQRTAGKCCLNGPLHRYECHKCSAAQAMEEGLVKNPRAIREFESSNESLMDWIVSNMCVAACLIPNVC